MQENDQLLGQLNWEEAIDRAPLIISEDLFLVDLLPLMSELQGSKCALGVRASSDYLESESEYFSSYALVQKNSQLLGIITERDIVKLAAQEVDFEKVRVGEVMTSPVITLNLDNFQDIFAPLFLFRRYQIRHLPILDANNNCLGVVSANTIRRLLRPINLLKLRRVGDVISHNVVTVIPEAKIINLIKLMSIRKVSCVVIVTKNNPESLKPIGIVTEKDIIQFKLLQLNLEKLIAKDVMSSPLFILSPEDSLWEAHQEMLRRKVRRMVVSWNWGKNLGIVTQTSILRVFDPMEMYQTIEILQKTIEQLEAEKTRLLAILNSSETNL
jgi:CBS domain-containing protein